MRRSVVVNKDDFAKPGWREKPSPWTVSSNGRRSRSEPPRGHERAPSELVAKDALRSRPERSAMVREVNAEIAPAQKPESRRHHPEIPCPGGDRPGSRPDAVIQDRGERDARPVPPVEGPGGISRAGKTESPGPGQPAPRFRDWNPDVRAGVRMGVDILYSSRTNEVYSPQLGLRSRDMIFRGRLRRRSERPPPASPPGPELRHRLGRRRQGTARRDPPRRPPFLLVGEERLLQGERRGKKQN